MDTSCSLTAPFALIDAQVAAESLGHFVCEDDNGAARWIWSQLQLCRPVGHHEYWSSALNLHVSQAQWTSDTSKSTLFVGFELARQAWLHPVVVNKQGDAVGFDAATCCMQQ